MRCQTESKYKIYISALTSLNVDEHNRISDEQTEDCCVGWCGMPGREERAQDRRLPMWPSVRRGEKENIFPFQEKCGCDVQFCVNLRALRCLKTYAEPLLYGIQKGDPEYYEAKRLLKFLDYFLGVQQREFAEKFDCAGVCRRQLLPRLKMGQACGNA